MSEDLTTIYPHLAFEKRWNLSAEGHHLLGQCEAYVAAISNVPLLPNLQRELLQVSLVRGAQATTAIEGNTLSEEEIKGIWAEGKHLPPSKSYLEQEVRNVLEAMNNIAHDVAQKQLAAPITQDLVRTFHQFIGKDLGAHFDAIPGRYREDNRVVGPYRCPDYQHIEPLMARYCAWLRQEFRFEQGQSFSSAVIQAIVAHIYLEWIHPFGDGNGRTGRLLEFYILLRGGLPTIASHILSNHYNQTRTAYYRHFQQAKESRNLTAFIEYALLGFRDGLAATLDTVQGQQWFIAWQHYVYALFQSDPSLVMKRRRDLILSLSLNGQSYLAEEMALTNPQITVSYAKLGTRTLMRDIEHLVALNLLRKEGKRYKPNIDLLRQFVPQKRAST